MAPPTKKLSIFITGGSGYIGSAVASLAIAHGHTVRSLSRTDEADAKLRSLGAAPVRGDLGSLDILRSESARADAVVHLASSYQFGSRGTYDDVLDFENTALDTIAEGMTSGGSGAEKTLLVASGTLMSEPDPHGRETDETAPRRPFGVPGFSRWKNEEHALQLGRSGRIRVAILRLAAWVYGHGGSGVGRFMGAVAQAGAVTVVDGGHNRITTVHVDDAASLCLLLAEQGRGEGGEVFNISSATDLTAAELWEAVAAAMGLPVRHITKEEAEAQLGTFITWFLVQENRASGAKAVRELGWKPSGPGLLEDIKQGSYHELAKKLRAGSAA